MNTYIMRHSLEQFKKFCNIPGQIQVFCIYLNS